MDFGRQLSKSIMRAIGGMFALFYSTIGLEAASNMIAALGPTGDGRVLLAFELGVMALGLTALGSAVIGFVNILRTRPEATDSDGEDRPFQQETAGSGSTVMSPAKAAQRPSFSRRTFGRRV